MSWIFFQVDQTRAQKAVLAIKTKWQQMTHVPTNAAVFALLDLRDRSMNFHFSPEAVRALPLLAQEHGGTECQEPTRKRGIWVLAGAADAIERLSRHAF